MPEDVVYLIYENIVNRYKSVEECIDALSQTGESQILPGSVISVEGILSFPELKTPKYDPFNPPSIEVPIFSVHGDRCFVGRLSTEGFVIPIYFPEVAKEQICFW